MDEIQLSVQARNQFRKQAVKKLRGQDFIPGIIYGGRHKTTPIQVQRRIYEQIRRHHHGEIVFSLEVNDGDKKKPSHCHAMVREEQHHPTSDRILHVDFIRISLTEKIEAHVPIEIKGEAVGVKRDGGSLDQIIWELSVTCLPTQIPEKVVVDVTSLEIDQAIHIRDVVLPEGVVANQESDEIVVAVKPPHREEILETTEGEEQAEPEVIKEKKAEKAEEEEAPEAQSKPAEKEKEE